MRVGVLPLARPTFDVAFAGEQAAAAFAALDATGHEIVGSRELLFDTPAAETALDELAGAALDAVLILQVTFTDADMTVAIADRLRSPLAIWAFPEPRLGGRLRLNAFCGLNLAAHALGLDGRSFGWLYGAPDAPDVGAALKALLNGGRRAEGPPLTGPEDGIEPTAEDQSLLERLNGMRIGRIGEHPPGFHTCDYDDGRLAELAGVSVEPIELQSLFDTAGGIDETAVAEIRDTVGDELEGLGEVDAGELDRSLRLKGALDRIRADGRYAAFAVRCWPETFTEYGGAVCGPVAMMGERRVPCACEADVYGALTSLILQEVADAPAFLADLVDIDEADGTAVVWHCGQAPISMADPQVAPKAAIHSNRRMPLLYEFSLKPGRITLARISQARGSQSMVIAGAEMIERPLAFSGTAGVLRFDTPAAEVCAKLIGAGLEHHMALVYGDCRERLRRLAAAMKLPLLEL
jgi:hypothetical protein